MSLEPGHSLGPYEIVAAAGAGGMGEVYRARDTRLDRTVAIKVLPPHMASDTRWQARFEREARSISALSHPGICALFDIGREEGVVFLVMEYLEGEVLSERLRRGTMPLDEALPLAAQIADALAAAHRQGIIHRDLKPGNIMLTKTGAKLLDFGLAKSMDPTQASDDASLVATATTPLTATGVVLGTYPYMSPEMLEGGEADARSDLFAVGAVIFEMITGRRAFAGNTQASVVASIMKEELPAVSSITASASPALDRVVQRCLAKDPDERWQSASDLASELRWINEGGGDLPASTAGPARPADESRRSARIAWGVTALLLIVATVLAVDAFREPETVRVRSIQFEVPAPSGGLFETIGDFASRVAVSPDGQHIVFGIREATGQKRLWLRSLATGELRVLNGTEDSYHPFWSADSRSVGFFADNQLLRVDIDGGAPLPVCDTGEARGGTWSAQGTIVFSTQPSGPLFQVSASGGTASQLTELGASDGSHRYPSFLPDGRRFLYLALPRSGSDGVGREADNRVMVSSLDGDEPRLLLQGISNAVFAGGHLVYLSGHKLMARPMDIDQLTFTEEPQLIVNEVQYDQGWEHGLFSATDDVLAYMPGTYRGEIQVSWFDRSTQQFDAVMDPFQGGEPALSPDGSRIAYRRADETGEGIWLYDLDRDVHSRFTFSAGPERAPVWSPDSQRIAYSSNQGASQDIYVRSSDGTGSAELLVDLEERVTPMDWSSDGRYLIYQVNHMGTQSNLWMADLEEGKEAPLLQTDNNESMGRLSPDQRWLAYVSDESGRSEVYVTPFPSLEGKWQISRAGGAEPLWGAEGKTLYFVRGNTILQAAVTVRGQGLEVGSAAPVLEVLSLVDIESPMFDLSADENRVLVRSFLPESARTPVTVKVNWLP